MECPIMAEPVAEIAERGVLVPETLLDCAA